MDNLKTIEMLEYIKTFDGMNYGATNIALNNAIEAVQKVNQYEELGDIEDIQLIFQLCKDLQLMCDRYAKIGTANDFERLKEAEKSGKLIELPCAINTPVYEVASYLDCEYGYDCPLDISDGKDSCESGCKCKHETKKFFVAKKLFTIDMLDKINKTIFLTEEEAKIVLEDLGGE